MKAEVIVAGHGGQGVLELANWLAYFHLRRGRHVAYTPSYGPETRGGKVKCYVVVSDETIDSPIVEAPDLLIVMNIPSMDYLPLLKPGGNLLVNSSLVKDAHRRTDVAVTKIPAVEIAAGLGEFGPTKGTDTSIAANSVMLGAALATTHEAPEHLPEEVEEVFRHFLTGRKAAFIPLNLHAVEAGAAFMARAGVLAAA